MANIFDVAKKAGVSIKTVSRVLNNAPNVRQATQDKVRASMMALDYQPSNAARELRSGRSKSIGILLGDPSSGFQARLHHAALQACSDAGFFLTVGLFDESADDWAGQLDDFLSRSRVENMILVPPLCDSEVLHAQMRDRGISFGLISPSRPVPDAYSIGMDEQQAAFDITMHLIRMGHRQIGHITGPTGHVATGLRLAGYQAALAESGIQPNPDWVRPGKFHFRDAQICAERMLANREERPTAIFAANDEMAAAVCFTANSLGLDVPRDLSVVGFDDVAIATTIWPPLTTVAQPFNAMADAAIRLLVNRPSETRSPPDSSILQLEYQLKIRSSAAPPIHQ